jgi:hypothetical protein
MWWRSGWDTPIRRSRSGYAHVIGEQLAEAAAIFARAVEAD